MNRSSLLWRILLTVLAAGSLTIPALSQTKPKASTPATGTKPSSRAAVKPKAPAPLTEQQRALHALNRLTFGPRPGDVEKVLAQGVDHWIEDQLHPESIPDNALDARLAPYRTLRMQPAELAASFPNDGILRQVMAGKRPMPADPLEKLVYSVHIARLKQQGAKLSADPAATLAQQQAEARDLGELLLSTPKEKRATMMEGVEPEKLVNFPNLLRPDQRDRLAADFNPAEREAFFALINPNVVIAGELQQQKVLRAVLSERQLLEVMTDFWFNHFNVFLYKDADIYYTGAYERDVIRPHALGKFRDLLIATAQSPAMLFYLDNWMSVGPHSTPAMRNKALGLNENYGRELMELHTLGVDGGYTQADVTEAARVFTGWTIDRPQEGGRFVFDPQRHEPGNKTLLGETIYDGGQAEGMHVLAMLAQNPSTAHFLSKEIAERFVADDPPESLVKKMAATYLSSDGDIREVLRTMVQSPEFWSPKYYRAKLKSPFEFLVSAVRASGTQLVNPQALVGQVNGMGMQLYGNQVPTGYSLQTEKWGTEGDLLARFNFASALTAGRIGGLQFDPAQLLTLGLLYSTDALHAGTPRGKQQTGAELATAILEDAILMGDLSPKDEEQIEKQLQNPDVVQQMAASPTAGLRVVTSFLLASPEFQRR